MNPKNIEKYKQRLLDIKENIAKLVQNITEENLNSEMRENSGDLSGYALHMADIGTENFDREFALNIAGRENETLHKVNMALEQCNAKTFGTCEMCSNDISENRLNAIPYALHCITCESKIEKEQS